MVKIFFFLVNLGRSISIFMLFIRHVYISLHINTSIHTHMHTHTQHNLLKNGIILYVDQYFRSIEANLFSVDTLYPTLFSLDQQ